MSVSSVGSSPVFQWLQSYLADAGSSKGNSSSCSCQPAGDTTSISKEAAQLNADQASQALDPSQTESVAGTRGHHHHRRHGEGGEGSFMDRLAQSIISDLQQATETGTAGDAESSTPATPSSSATGGSFIDKLAQSIANDLLSKYHQDSGAGKPASPANATSQVNVIA